MVAQVLLESKRACRPETTCAWLQMEMDEDEKQLVQEANAQGAPAAAADAAPPVPQDEEEDILVRVLQMDTSRDVVLIVLPSPVCVFSECTP